MKKIILSVILLICIVFTSSNTEAKTYTYDTYQDLGVYTAMIVGDYVFSLDEGYSPTLEDIMVATRTIPKEKPVYLYYVMNYGSIFYHLDMYSNEYSTNKEDFKVFTAKYLFYKNNVKTAEEGDYIEI